MVAAGQGSSHRQTRDLDFFPDNASPPPGHACLRLFPNLHETAPSQPLVMICRDMMSCVWSLTATFLEIWTLTILPTFPPKHGFMRDCPVREQNEVICGV